MKPKTKLFLILWLAGLSGVFSFLLVDVNALLRIMPLPAGTEVPTFTPALMLLSLIQPSVVLLIAVLVGVGLASKVGLSSPAAEAAASGGHVFEALKPQILPGILGGLAGGISVVLIAFVSKLFLPLGAAERISEFGTFVPLATRLLYGGITEELLLRWGLMTLLVWTGWKLFQKSEGAPQPALIITAILLSSVIFGIGHLPVAFLLFPEPTAALTLFVIIGNSAFGLIAGYLYWKKGLESAMIAHMLAHLVMFTATYFGAYF